MVIREEMASTTSLVARDLKNALVGLSPNLSQCNCAIEHLSLGVHPPPARDGEAWQLGLVCLYHKGSSEDFHKPF